MNVLDRIPAALREPALALSALALLGWWVISSTPFTERMPHAVPPLSGIYADYFVDISIGAPISGPWALQEVRASDAAITAHLTDGASIYDVYFTDPDFDRRPGGLRMTWFKRYVPRVPADDPADFRRAVHVLSVALERGSKQARPWSYARFPANLPPRAYQGALLLLLAALAGLGRRHLRRSRPALGAALGFVALLAAGFTLRMLFSPLAPLHANQHGLEEIDQFVFPIESPYPSYYGRTQGALEDLLLWCLPGSAATLFTLHAVLGVLGSAGAGLLALSLSGSRLAGWTTTIMALLSPHLVRVSTSESGFIWVVVLLFPTLWGLVRYARDGDRLGLAAGGAGTLLLTHLHAITPVFLALPAAAWLMAPRGLRGRRFAGLGLLTLGLGLLLLPHLTFIMKLHEARGTGLMSEALPGLPSRIFDPGSLALNPETSPAVISLAALVGLALLWWRHRSVAAFVTAVTPLFLATFLLQTCWTDMVRYQAPLAAWLTVPAGLGVGLGIPLLRRRRWRVAAAALVLGIGAVSLPGPWAAHLRPDLEASEYLFLDEVVRGLPQHGILVVPPQGPGISSYVPRTLFLQSGRSYRIVDATELRNLNARNALGEEPIYYYRGLGYAWLEYYALEASPIVEAADRDEARETLAATQRGLSGFQAEVVARRRMVRQTCAAAGYRMDFNELPGPFVEIQLLRLSPN
ncbi:MAG: hypothetical protein ABIK09_07020 [Pseudomonadota bacterium]